MKVSVIICSYNGEDTIEKALQSVVNQSAFKSGEHEKEILLYDDCSADRARITEIARKYSCKLAFSPSTTGGPSYGRNQGAKEATGDFIAYIDQDDEWLPEKIHLQILLLELYQHDLAFSSFESSIKYERVLTDCPIHKRISTLNFSEGGLCVSSILVRNKNIPMFTDYQLDYAWGLDITRDRRCLQTYPLVKRGITGQNLSRDFIYIIRDYHFRKSIIKDPKIKKKLAGRLARYLYVTDKPDLARYYFLRSRMGVKEVLYYLTSYLPPIRKFIVKRFGVYGA